MQKLPTIIFLVILCIVIINHSLHAQAQYSIQQLIDSALHSFELLKAQQAKIDEVDAFHKYATQWKNPELSTYIGNKSIDSQKGRVAGIAVTQPLYFPGKLSLIDEVYRYKKNYEVLSYEEMKYFIATSVINLSYDYAISQLRSLHINSRIKRLNILNTYMTARPVVSPQKKVEIAIVKNSIRMLQSEIHRIKADQAVTFARLTLYTQLDVPEMKVAIKWIENPPVFNINDVIVRGKSESLMVKKQKELLMASLKEISLAQKNRYPDFSILFSYDYEKVTEKEQSISGGISIPIPIYNQNQNAVDIMQSKAKQEELYAQYVEKMIESDIRTTVAHYDYYRNLLQLFPPSMEDELEQSMYYADDQFQKGTITLQSYLELDVQVHETLEHIYTTQKELVRNMAAIATIINDYNLLMEIAQ